MTEHTPTPYQYTPYPGLCGGTACGVIECTEAVRQEGRVVAYIRSGPNMPDDEADANAAFIIRAVNSHEALVAVLRAVEWAGGRATITGLCLLCRNYHHQGHAPDCPLAKALRDAEGE